MTPIYYDKDGNPVENLLTPEETTKIAEEKKALEEESIKLKEQLSKLESKDYNWKRLREMNEEEKKTLTAKEMELLKRQEAIEEAQGKFQEEQKAIREKELSSYRDEALDRFAGADEELKKKVLFHFNRLGDEAITKSAIEKKVSDAWILATGGQTPKVNPILNAFAAQGQNNVFGESKKEKLNADQVDLAKKLGISEDVLKKQGLI